MENCGQRENGIIGADGLTGMSWQAAKAALAEDYFHKGYNCSQSVAAAFTQELGLPENIVLKLSCGFGGGVGRMREVCGAFTGLVMVISMYYTDPADPNDKSRIYGIVQQLAEQFRQQSGGDSIICRQLLGLEKPEGSPQAEARTAAYYKKRPCVELVGVAAQITADYIAAHPAAKA